MKINSISVLAAITLLFGYTQGALASSKKTDTIQINSELPLKNAIDLSMSRATKNDKNFKFYQAFEGLDLEKKVKIVDFNDWQKELKSYATQTNNLLILYDNGFFIKNIQKYSVLSCYDNLLRTVCGTVNNRILESAGSFNEVLSHAVPERYIINLIGFKFQDYNSRAFLSQNKSNSWEKNLNDFLSKNHMKASYDGNVINITIK